MGNTIPLAKQPYIGGEFPPHLYVVSMGFNTYITIVIIVVQKGNTYMQHKSLLNVDKISQEERVKALIEILNKIENDKRIEVDEKGFLTSKVDDLYPDLSFLCDRGLITDKGSNNTLAHIALEDAGYGWRIRPLEQDRFGWLRAGIYLKKGIYVYG